MPNPIPAGPLRIVTFNVLPFAYRSLASWITANGHQHIAVVTTPGPTSRRSDSYREIVALAPPAQDVIVTTHVRRIAAHLRALQPDVLMTFTFPYRLPAEILEIPRYGAVNLHPTLLPAYRGPNPMRPLYDGVPVFGSTLHRMDAEFDTGPILAQHSSPVPDNLTPELLGMGLFQSASGALSQGMAAFIAGEAGRVQDEQEATYAAPFSAAEQLLDWDIPAQLLVRRCVALQIFGHTPRVTIDGVQLALRKVTVVADAGQHNAGTVLARTDAGWQIAVADGVLEVIAVPLEA